MTDTLTKQQRHFCMSSIRSRDTGPEAAVRKVLRAARIRYRSHRRDLPGTPDFALDGHRVAVMVHGCFWHAHRCRKGSKLPATRRAFWLRKRESNIARDRKVRSQLRRLGWRVVTIWECRTGDTTELRKRLASAMHRRRLGKSRRRTPRFQGDSVPAARCRRTP